MPSLEFNLPEAEEISDLLIAGGRSDVLNVDSSFGRHFGCFVVCEESKGYQICMEVLW